MKGNKKNCKKQLRGYRILFGSIIFQLTKKMKIGPFSIIGSRLEFQQEFPTCRQLCLLWSPKISDTQWGKVSGNLMYKA